MNPDRRLEVTHQVSVRLGDQVDAEVLEELAEKVDEAVRRDACGALGLAVGISYVPSEIKLRFQTLAPTASSRAQQMSAVYAAIERALDRSLETQADETRALVATS